MYGSHMGDIGAAGKMLQDLPSKFFKELEGLIGHTWPSVVIENHFPIQELIPAVVPDGLLDPQLRVAIPLSVTVLPHCSR